MKTPFITKENGSVLLVAMMTITIMTLICATSLYIATQNTGSGMQTSGWQQALTAAESGVDAAIRALNENGTSGANAWTNWKVVPYSSPATNYALPTIEPTATATPSATAGPDSSHYNYLPSSSPSPLFVSFPNSEGATSVSAWVTIDTVGATNLVSGGQQWYRVRSTGQTTYPSNSVILKRVSNNRLDNDLRNTIAMNFNRKGGSYAGPARTIQVILSPVVGGGWARAITMKSGIQMSGSGTVDSFNSNSVPYPYAWTLPYRDNPGQAQIGLINNTSNSDLRNTYVYGSLTYSGTPVQNTTNVQGTVSTPFNATVTSTVDPSSSGWGTTDNLQQYGSSQQSTINAFSAGNYTAWTGGGGLPKNAQNQTLSSVTVTGGNQSSPTLIKVNGDFTVPGGQSFTISNSNNGNGAGAAGYVIIWITGQFTTSGSGVINQASNVYVTYIVDSDITVSGNSYNNQAGKAANLEFVGVGTGHKVTDSGSATFTGTINAPGYDVTVSGSGDFTGAMIGNSLTISGGASFHYDDALSNKGGSSTVGNYSFASWFEDNSDPTRNALDNSGVNHPIVY